MTARPSLSTTAQPKLMAVLLLMGTTVGPRLAHADDEVEADADEAEETPPDELPADPEVPVEGPPPSPPPEDGGWQTLGLEPDFGSAVESGFETQAAEEGSRDGLQGLFASSSLDLPAPSRRPMSRLGLRPWLGIQGTVPRDAPSEWGGAAGVRVIQHWWTLSDKTVRPSGETRLHAAGLFGGVRGYELTLDTAGGAWLGPMGLFVGGQAGADRRDWDASEAVERVPALGVGPSAAVALKLGSVRTLVGATPVWLVAGERKGLSVAPWDELALRGGLVFDQEWSELRLSGGYREVATGALWEAALGVHLRFGQP